MDTKKELKILFWMIVVYAAVFFMPLGNERFMTAVDATLDLAKWYAQEHVMLCLLLYSGPAISILSIILTARILGVEMGVARTVGAIGFSVVIALLWHLFSVRKRKPNKRNR